MLYRSFIAFVQWEFGWKNRAVVHIVMILLLLAAVETVVMLVTNILKII